MADNDTKAAERIVAHMGEWKMPAGRWIEKDALIVAQAYLAQSAEIARLTAERDWALKRFVDFTNKVIKDSSIRAQQYSAMVLRTEAVGFALATVTKERDAMAEALASIKKMVCGEKYPRWGGDLSTAKSRSKIADFCDDALAKLAGARGCRQ